MLLFYILCTFIILFALWYVHAMKRFAHLRHAITQTTFSLQKVLLQRLDILIQMYDMTRPYAKQETEQRLHAIHIDADMTANAYAKVHEQLSAISNYFELLSKAVPEIHHTKSFMELQKFHEEVEDKFYFTYRIYSVNVNSYNQLLTTFPHNIVASLHERSQGAVFE